jgi:threonine synthase
MPDWRLVCAGCGAPAPPVEINPYPFRCEHARTTPEVDHVITKVRDPGEFAWPTGSEDNPFVRYRQLFYSWQAARAAGQSDAGYVTLVERLDDAIAAVAGQRFRVTPFARSGALSSALGFGPEGGVWVKDETGNVSGSHKARHLTGIMLYLHSAHAAHSDLVEFQFLQSDRAEALQKLKSAGYPTLPDLAIASCGNAALAAAVVARAAGWTLQTFIPPDANPAVVARLRELGARLVVCPREGATAGDPCYRGFRQAIDKGALPFCCQGPDNGLTIEGGETIVYEMVDALGDAALDAIVIQVGGGALASACVQGFDRARAAGRIRRLPRVYTVQTQGAAPLARAFDRVLERSRRTSVEEVLRYAAANRSEFMWPWETAPRSIAHGILDDETYDWLAVVRGLLKTSGRPVVVDDATLIAANRQARDLTGIDVDHTGSAGLAGLMGLLSRGDVQPHERVAVIFSGALR